MVEVEIVRIPVDSTLARELEDAIRARQSDFLAAPHCIGLIVARNQAVGEVVAIVTWASPEAHAAALAGEGAGKLFAALGQFAAGPPTIEKMDAERVTGSRLAGQVALVPGGGAGIGLAVVERFLAEGAQVGVADINAGHLAALKERHGDRVETVATDLSSPEGNELAVERTVSAFGKLDSYVANAGVFDGFADFAALDVQALSKAFDAIFDINVRGLILGCRAALPHLAATRGSIIVTLSNASLYPDGGGVMYVASKHAALGVVRQLAHEFAPAIRVNAVAPGATKTGILVPKSYGIALDQQSPEVSAAIAAMVPLNEHSEPTVHADAYVLLAARRESQAMTGTIIVSDGGLGIRGLRRIRGGDSLLEPVSGDSP